MVIANTTSSDNIVQPGSYALSVSLLTQVVLVFLFMYFYGCTGAMSPEIIGVVIEPLILMLDWQGAT